MYVKKAWKCSVLADLILPSDEWDVMRCLSGISLIYLEDCSSSLLLLLGKSGLIEILLFIIGLVASPDFIIRWSISFLHDFQSNLEVVKRVIEVSPSGLVSSC